MKSETKLEKVVIQNIKKNKLCNKNEKILVALSSGKDSTLTAYLLKKFGYDVEGIHIDLGIGEYSKKCLKAVEKLCKNLKIKLHVYNLKKEQGRGMKFFWNKNKTLNHCAVCGVIKKWVLNKEARKLEADKIATGHNLDDETETFILNILKGSTKLSENSGPITKNFSDKKFIPRIKPLFYLLNKDVEKYFKKSRFYFIEGACPYREDSYRIYVRKFLNTLSKKDKENIIKNAQKILKKIKIEDTKVQYCEICGEPSRNKICKRCRLMKIT